MIVIDYARRWLGHAASTEPHLISITMAGQEHKFTAGMVGDGETRSNLRITWINGIANDLDHCQKSAKIISELFEQNVHYLHNPSFGVVSDVIRTGWHKLGYDCTEALALSQLFREQIASLGGSASGGRILHLAHSHGALVTQIAATCLTDEEKAMIDVVTFGPARLVSPDDGFRSATNYVSYADWVSRHDGKINRAARGYFSGDEVKLLKPLNQTDYIDHRFTSPTYQTALKCHRIGYLDSIKADEGLVTWLTRPILRYFSYYVFERVLGTEEGVTRCLGR